MAFTVSPGIVTREIDLTSIVPESSTGAAAVIGAYRWGPIEEKTGVLCTSEDDLVNNFFEPDNNSYNYFFTAANYLAYGNNLRVIRIANSTALNSTTDSANAVLIKNHDSYYTTYDSKNGGTPSNDFGDWAAKYAGSMGDSLKISTCAADIKALTTITGSDLAIGAPSADEHTMTGTGSAFTTELQVGSVVLSSSNTYIVTAIASDTSATVYGEDRSAQTTGASISRLKSSGFFENANTTIGKAAVAAGNTTVTGTKTKFDLQFRIGDTITLGGQDRRVSTITSATSIEVDTKFTNAVTASVFTRAWEYEKSFDTAPTTTTFGVQKGVEFDEVHIVVIDEDGRWTGTKGQVLETFPNLSVATDALGEDGTSQYYADVVNRDSKYVWWMSHLLGANATTGGKAWGTSAQTNGSGTFYAGNGNISTESFTGGISGTGTVTDANLITGYDLLKNEESIDVSLIPTCNASSTVVNHIIDNIANVRKDCMVLVSPSGLNNTADTIVTARNALNSTSYAVMDSGFKYQYDKYNDVYRYVPSNGDMAGLMVRTDEERDFFFSPAGFDRGQVKNVVRMAFNPNKTERDILYKNGVNPIVSFAGQGTVLFGDKTLLAKPSAFDRINVRRLFITLEKSISTFAQASLFEFNDEFTRARFVSAVEPFLRDIQGRGGITDFAVVCDESNNTSEVVDRNEFVGSIFVKPTRSINFILLNFVAVRSGVEFSEITNV